MKKLLLIAVLIAACLSATAYVACVAAPLLGKNIKGSGKIVTKTVPAPDFDSIEASRAVKVVISDKVSDIRIEADDNLIDLVVVRAVKGKLEATLDQKVNNIQNGNVTITVPANGKIFERLEDHRRNDAQSRQIQHRGFERRQDQSRGGSRLLHHRNIERLEGRGLDRGRKLFARRIERIENHPRRFRRDVQGRHEFGIETQRRKILGRQRHDRHVERRQRFDRLQRKTHRQRIERLVGPLLGRLPDFAGKVERRQHPQTLNSETTRQP